MGRAGFCHLFQGRFHGDKDDTLAGTCDVRQKAMLDRIEFRFIRRIVGDADFQADAVCQFFQGVFEDIPVGRVAAAAVAQQQDRAGLWIMDTPVMLPGKGHAITSEIAGVVANAEVNVPVISLDIVDAMRVDDARGIAGKSWSRVSMVSCV